MYDTSICRFMYDISNLIYHFVRDISTCFPTVISLEPLRSFPETKFPEIRDS